MRFKKDWDNTLKKYYNLIKQQYCYEIAISSRTPFFTKKHGKEIFYDHDHIDPFAIKRENINCFNLKQNIYKEEYREGIWDNTDYIETHFLSGHFIFSTNELFKQIMPDPRIHMFGEEHILALRAWTNNFRIFSIKESVIYHLDKQNEYLDDKGIHDWRNTIQKQEKAALINKYRLYYRDILLGKEYGFLAAKNEEQYLDYIDEMGYDYRDIL